MAVRTNSTNVRRCLARDYDQANLPDLTLDVRSASYVIDDVVAQAAEDGVTFASARALDCETWLACWFYTARDPMYSSRSTLSASGSFLRGKDEYLERAKALDPTGTLESFLRGNVARLNWGGKTQSEQIDYVDRDANP